MFRTLLFILGIYFLYRFVFGFLVPLFRTTARMQQQLRSMQEKMDDQMNPGRNNRNAANSQQASSSASSNTKPPRHEYIDFEEIK